MSAIQLFRVSALAIPLPDIDSAFVFLDPAGVLSYKQADGSVSHASGAPGAASTVAGPAGPAGPAGAAGAPGAASTVAGPAGPAGAAGAPGAASTVAGPAGIAGANGAPGAASTVAGPAGPAGAVGQIGQIGPIGQNGAVGPAGPGRESIYVGIAAQVEVTNTVADLIAINFDLLAGKAVTGDTIYLLMHGECDPAATATSMSAFVTIWGNRVNSGFAQNMGAVARTPYTIEQWLTFRPGQVCAVVQRMTFGLSAIVKITTTTVVAANTAVTMTIKAGVNMGAANASKLRVTAGYLQRI